MEKPPIEGPKAVSCLVCGIGGDKYLEDKHLQRFGLPEKIFEKRSPSVQTAPGSRAKSAETQRVQAKGAVFAVRANR